VETLDNFCTSFRIQKIDIIKIDAEGSEVEILKGAKTALKLTSKIVIEVNSDELRNQTKNFLESNGFKRVLEVETPPTFLIYFERFEGMI